MACRYVFFNFITILLMLFSSLPCRAGLYDEEVNAGYRDHFFFSSKLPLPHFPAQYYDGETGLNYNWHRYYDPKLGRYIQADPIRLDGGENMYAYVGNDPMGVIDPEGLDGIHVMLHDARDPKHQELGQERYQGMIDQTIAIKVPDGFCFVSGHGAPGHIRDGIAQKSLGAEALENLLKSRGCTEKMPLVILACKTGKGQGSLARQMSRYHPTVEASTEDLGYKIGGEYRGLFNVEGKIKTFRQEDFAECSKSLACKADAD